MEMKNKITFLEAFFFTIGIFIIGILIGMGTEDKNINQMNEVYIDSQVTMFDTYLASTLINEDSSCDFIKSESIKLADRIYEEAEMMDEYESYSQIGDTIKFVHKKYDVLRTMLWDISGSYIDKCDNYNIVVYLYEYDSDDVNKKAKQNVWSKLLYEVKQNRSDVILIPIAVDQGLLSLNTILSKYDIEQYPAVIVNNDKIYYDTMTVSEFESAI
jgi:hypothetical protein